MGFMGLKSYVESDAAAGFEYSIRKSLNKAFGKELENEGNKYNTPGWLNALLIFKEYPAFVEMLDDDILECIDDRIKADHDFTFHESQALVRSYAMLVANFRKLKEEKK